MCRLAEVRENLMPIIEEIRKRRTFEKPSEFIIGDSNNNEKLTVVLRENNLHNTISVTILFENINLEIFSKNVSVDFQIILKLGDTNDISIYDLELLLIPNAILQEYKENQISKVIIACWNVALK